MATISQRNPIVRTTSIVARTSDVILNTNPIINLVGDRFILEVDESIPFGITFPTTLDDTVETYSIFDRYGNYVRADRLYSAIQFRRVGLLPFNGCNPRQFQCVLGMDPGRINILCCLPRSNYGNASTSTSTLSITDNANTTTSSATTTTNSTPTTGGNS